MASLALALLGAALAAAPRGAAAAPSPLRMLTDTRATCLDGSLGGFYFEPYNDPSEANATKWVIFLQGGGECASNASCSAAAKSELGSSKYFAPSIEFDEGEYYASGLPGNPFASWNRVDIPYCSQDLFSGTRESTSPDTFGLYFSGHLIFESILQTLKDQYALDAATEVILTGVSAGGIGAWLNTNSLVTSFVPAGCRVTIAPIAGMYFFACVNRRAPPSPLSLSQFSAVCSAQLTPPRPPVCAYIMPAQVPVHERESHRIDARRLPRAGLARQRRALEELHRPGLRGGSR